MENLYSNVDYENNSDSAGYAAILSQIERIDKKIHKLQKKNKNGKKNVSN